VPLPAPSLLLTGVAAASRVLAASSVAAQQARRMPLRPSVPAYVAQPTVPDLPAAPLSATPDSVRDPAALIQGQPTTVSRRAPPFASRPVRASGVRGVTQRQFRAPQIGRASCRERV